MRRHLLLGALMCAVGLLLALPVAASASQVTPIPATLQNGGFETYNGSGPSGGWPVGKAAADVLGWETTDVNGEIELWPSGPNGGDSHEGSVFAEVNANNSGSTLYQDIQLPAGTTFGFSFAHRGRFGVDVLSLTITDLGSDGLVGGTGDDADEELFTKNYTDDKTAWGEYSSEGEEIPASSGNVTRFAFSDVSSIGGAGVGNFLDGITFGAATAHDPQAGFANALKLSDPADGSFVKTESFDSVQFSGESNFTLEFWVKPSKAGTIYHHYASTNQLQTLIGFSDDSSDASKGLLYFGLGKYSVGWSWFASDTQIDYADQWAHVAFVKDGVMGRLYVNGELDSEVDMTGKAALYANASTSPIYIGYDPDGAGTYGPGIYDEYRLWNVALSKATLDNWRYRGADVSHPNWDDLLIYYPFDETSGTTVHNLKDPAHNGTVTDKNDGAPTNYSWLVSTVGLEHTTLEDTAYSSRLPHYDEDGGDLWAELTVQAAHGTVLITDAKTGAYTYTPDKDFNGDDTFSYTIADEEPTPAAAPLGGPLKTVSNEKTVEIEVLPVDDPITLSLTLTPETVTFCGDVEASATVGEETTSTEFRVDEGDWAAMTYDETDDAWQTTIEHPFVGEHPVAVRYATGEGWSDSVTETFTVEPAELGVTYTGPSVLCGPVTILKAQVGSDCDCCVKCAPVTFTLTPVGGGKSLTYRGAAAANGSVCVPAVLPYRVYEVAVSVADRDLGGTSDPECLGATSGPTLLAVLDPCATSRGAGRYEAPEAEQEETDFGYSVTVKTVRKKTTVSGELRWVNEGANRLTGVISGYQTTAAPVISGYTFSKSALLSGTGTLWDWDGEQQTWVDPREVTFTAWVADGGIVTQKVGKKTVKVERPDAFGLETSPDVDGESEPQILTGGALTIK